MRKSGEAIELTIEFLTDLDLSLTESKCSI